MPRDLGFDDDDLVNRQNTFRTCYLQNYEVKRFVVNCKKREEKEWGEGGYFLTMFRWVHFNFSPTFGSVASCRTHLMKYQ